MSDQQLRVNNQVQDSTSVLVKISTLLILVVLVGIAALLYSLNRKLDTLGLFAPPPEAPLTTLTAMQSPLAIPPAPAPAPAVRRAVTRPTVNRNYTGAARETVSPIPAHEHSVASVVPTQPQQTMPAPVYVPAPVEQSPSYQPTQSVVPRLASLPQGTILTIRMINSLSSDTSRAGDRFAASLDEPIYANGVMAVPAGATVEGRVINAERAGRVSGLAELSVQLDRLQLPSGDSVSLATEIVSRQGEGSRTQDVAKVGIGAAIGAAIGAVAGGRKGAGVGAATGAGAGTAGVLLTRGKPAVLAPETRLSFSLAAPVEFEMAGYSQSTSAAAPNNLAPVWPAPRSDPNDPFEGQRPRLRRRMM